MLTQFHKISRQLMPRARAWWLPLGGIFDRVMSAFAESENDAKDKADTILSATLPDNDDFTVTDAENWEKALSIPLNDNTTLDARKIAIKDRINFPGEKLPRQSAEYLQERLQAAGFDVYVHENETEQPLQDSLYGTFLYGQALYGTQAANGEPICNYIDAAKDADFIFSIGQNLRATFFIAAEIFPNFASVPAARKNEFRELILKIKPAQTAGQTLVNYA